MSPSLSATNPGINLGLSAANTLFGTGTSSSPISLSPASWISSLFTGSGDRIAAIVLGLIFIGGAILLYIGDDVAGAIETGGKIAAKVGG